VGETAAISDHMPFLYVLKVPQYYLCAQDAKPILAAQAHCQTWIRGEFDTMSKIYFFTLLTYGQSDTIHRFSI
jgi:hypothetical protein